MIVLLETNGPEKTEKAIQRMGDAKVHAKKEVACRGWSGRLEESGERAGWQEVTPYS